MDSDEEMESREGDFFSKKDANDYNNLPFYQEAISSTYTTYFRTYATSSSTKHPTKYATYCTTTTFMRLSCRSYESEEMNEEETVNISDMRLRTLCSDRKSVV